MQFLSLRLIVEKWRCSQPVTGISSSFLGMPCDLTNALVVLLNLVQRIFRSYSLMITLLSLEVNSSMSIIHKCRSSYYKNRNLMQKLASVQFDKPKWLLGSLDSWIYSFLISPSWSLKWKSYKISCWTTCFSHPRIVFGGASFLLLKVWRCLAFMYWIPEDKSYNGAGQVLFTNDLI